MTSSMACRPYSDSEMISPARNAPTASENPAAPAASAVATAKKPTHRVNRSRSRVSTIRSRVQRTTNRPARDEGGHRREPQPEPQPEAAGLARGEGGAGPAAGEGVPTPTRPGREQGHDEHQGHDGEVLEEQDGDGLAAVRGVEFAAVGEGLADHGGGRQRREGAVEQALPRREAEQRTRRRREAHHPEHLQAARDQDRRAPPQHLRQRELEPDLEQQQHHPISARAATASGSGMNAAPWGPMATPTSRNPTSVGRRRRCARAATGIARPTMRARLPRTARSCMARGGPPPAVSGPGGGSTRSGTRGRCGCARAGCRRTRASRRCG